MGLGVCAGLTGGLEAPGEVLERGDDGVWHVWGAGDASPETGWQVWRGAKDRISVEVCGGRGARGRDGRKRVTFVYTPDVDRIVSFFRSMSTPEGGGGGGSDGQRGEAGAGSRALMVWSIPLSELQQVADFADRILCECV